MWIKNFDYFCSPIKILMINIEEGQQYLLDNKIVVTVIKAVTRSRNTFSVALPDKSINTVDKDRLKVIPVVAWSYAFSFLLIHRIRCVIIATLRCIVVSNGLWRPMLFQQSHCFLFSHALQTTWNQLRSGVRSTRNRLQRYARRLSLIPQAKRSALRYYRLKTRGARVTSRVFGQDMLRSRFMSARPAKPLPWLFHPISHPAQVLVTTIPSIFQEKPIVLTWKT